MNIFLKVSSFVNMFWAYRVSMETCCEWQALVLTDEDDQQQTGGVQLDVGVTERVTERGVDDHEEDGAADDAERRLLPLQELPEEPSTHLETHTHQRDVQAETNTVQLTTTHNTHTNSYLTQDQRHHNRHEELREDGGEGN